MTVYEILTIAVTVVLATAATAAIYLGLLNWVGGVFIVRCAACHHLTLSPVKQAQQSCPHCRHPVLTHPLYTVRHSGQPAQVRVVGDELRYCPTRKSLAARPVQRRKACEKLVVSL